MSSITLYCYTWFLVRVTDFLKEEDIDSETVLRDIDVTEEAAKIIIGD